MSCPLWHCLTHNMFDDRVQMYLQELPRAVATLTQVAVAQRRLSTFLGKSELEHDESDVRKESPANDGFGVALIEKASFSWDEEGKGQPTLSGVDFCARGGALAVRGSTLILLFVVLL